MKRREFIGAKVEEHAAIDKATAIGVTNSGRRARYAAPPPLLSAGDEGQRRPYQLHPKQS